MTRIGTIALAASALWWTAAPAAAQAPEEGGWQEPAEPQESAEPEPAGEPAPSKIDVTGSEGGKIDVSSEPPPEAVPRSHHVHDGFYLRVAMGLGWLGADFNDDSALDASAEAERGSFALDLMIGGSPDRGLAIGGALLGEGMFGAKYEHDGDQIGDGNVAVGLIGGFIDGHPDPKGGFHVGGALGFSSVTAEELGPDGDNIDTAGLGGAVWLGYDFWVGSEWSLGPLVRVMATVNRDRGDETDVTAVTRSLTASFTALYH